MVPKTTRPHLPLPLTINAPIPDAEAVLGVPWSPCDLLPLHRLDGRLDRRQAVALRFVHYGLARRGATLKDRHMVSSPLDAVRWFLEAVADDIGLDAVGLIPPTRPAPGSGTVR